MQSRIDAGEHSVPAGVSWKFSGNYEHQFRAARTLGIVLPVLTSTGRGPSPHRHDRHEQAH